MAGTIAITEEDQWSAPSWAYHWVLDYLIDHATNPETVDKLREVDANNLPWVGIHTFPLICRVELLKLLTQGLVPDAEQRLLPEIPDRHFALDTIRELRTLASKHVP